MARKNCILEENICKQKSCKLLQMTNIDSADDI